MEDAEDEATPILINAGALGHNRPALDLIVSPQHRILVGGAGQLKRVFAQEAFAPAKSLTKLPRIRHMNGKERVTWVHFACDRHEIVIANGCLSESLLLGPMILNGLTSTERQALTDIYGPAPSPDAAMNGPSARTCLKVGEVRRLVEKQSKDVFKRAARELRKWDRDLAMEKYETERLQDADAGTQSRGTAARVA